MVYHWLFFCKGKKQKTKKLNNNNSINNSDFVRANPLANKAQIQTLKQSHYCMPFFHPCKLSPVAQRIQKLKQSHYRVPLCESSEDGWKEGDMENLQF